MCLIAWNWQPHSSTPLLLLSNRDEFYARPTQALHWWEQTARPSDVLAGRDSQAGGTWLGVSRCGRLAALTNYRTPEPVPADRPSRGELVAEFLGGQTSAEAFLHQLSPRSSHYNPFNLLVYDGTRLMGLQSQGSQLVALPPGIGAVSNANFHTPWPKLARLTQGLASQVEQPASADTLLPLLLDKQVANDAELPRTGIPLELERMLSGIFITSPHYGTRACSVVTVHSHSIDFTEHSFDAQGQTGKVRHHFKLETPATRI
jgi:uncharacterized protein with NRDE domain